MRYKGGEDYYSRELYTMAKFDDCEFPSCLGTLVLFIISGLVKNSVRKQFWIFQTAITWAVIDGF